MIVTIMFFSPYSEAVGKKKIEVQVKEKEKLNITELLIELKKIYPNLQSLLPKTLNQSGIYGNLFPVRDGQMLHMEDEIHDQDVLKIYGSLSGG